MSGERWKKTLIVIVILVPVVFLIFYFMRVFWIFDVFNFIAEKLEKGLNINGNLAKVAAAILWLPLLYFVHSALSLFSKKRQLIGLVGVSVYVAVYFTLAWAAHRDTYFDTTGPVRWYALTPEGYRFYDEPGVDPTYGMTLKPVTQEIVELVRQRSDEMTQIHELDEAPQLFDPITGDAKVWYGLDPAGEITLFSRNGFHPQTGERLQAITADIVKRYREDVRDQEVTRARRDRERESQAYRNRLVNYGSIGIERRSEKRTLLGILADGPSEGVVALKSGLAGLISQSGWTPINGVFRREFFESDHFGDLMNGDTSSLEALLLVEECVVVGRAMFQEVSSKKFEDLVTVRATCDLMAVGPSQSFKKLRTFTATGPGFTVGDAAKKASERILDQVRAEGLFPGNH